MNLSNALLKGVALLSLLGGVFATANAATKHHRVMWDSDPSSNAVIGFSPDGSSSGQYVTYGYSTDEATWSTANVSATRTFQGSLTSYFVRLTGLTANSAVHYRVCDNSGCGDRFWFKTAPNDNTPFIAVAGGDTRTGWTTRREGNKLIAKLRPLFIMHGGDFTNANNVSEMNSYLTDWTHTYSSDTINGIAYKRIYPFIPTHGNHEDNNYSTLCEVFGVDYNNDGVCNPNDTYGAFNISPLLRVYTLNSQFKNSGWSSYASAMNNWLTNDLATNGNSAMWRFAQYHKPIFPHYTGKAENYDLFDWWASTFFNNAMNLVVESDTHMNKLTKPVQPSNNDFTEANDGGVVFVGEGSWGAPARSANDAKSWTIDLASIQQFKVITVDSTRLQVRTAQFDSSAATLTRDQRAADPTVLPANVNWWSAYGIGEVLKLIQNASKKSVIEGDNTGPGTVIELTNGQTETVAGAKNEKTMYKIEVPSGATNLTVNMNGGSGDADLYVRFANEPTLTAYDCRPYKNGNTESCSFATPQVGTYFIMLNGYSEYANVSLTASYSGGSSQVAPVAGFNETINNLNVQFSNTSSDSDGTISSHLWDFGDGNSSTLASPSHTYTAEGTYTVQLTVVDNDGLSDTASKSITVTDSTGGNQLTNGVPVTNLNAAKNGELLYTIDVPANASNLSVSISDGTGDADLYVLFASEPSSSNYDCRPYKSGNAESCSFATPSNGTYYIKLIGYAAFDGVKLVASYTTGGVPSNELVNGVAKTGLSGNQGNESTYYIDVPAGTSSLTFNTSGGSGDVDLYVRAGSVPTQSSYDCRPYKNGNSETCSFSNPTATRYHVMLRAYQSYSGVSLVANF